MAKKITKSTGLSETLAPQPKKKAEQKKLSNKALFSKEPRGFRLSLKDQSILRNTTEDVAELTPTKISDTHIIRAMIHIASDMDPNVILAKIKDLSVL